MKLLNDEKELVSTNEGILVLTSRRVRLDQRGGGQSQLVSIMLEQVASCGLVTRSYPALLVLAALVVAYGVIAEQLNSGLLLAAVLGIAYFLTRTALLSIASAGARIEIAARSLSRDSLVDFIDSVEAAIAARVA